MGLAGLLGQLERDEGDGVSGFIGEEEEFDDFPVRRWLQNFVIPLVRLNRRTREFAVAIARSLIRRVLERKTGVTNVNDEKVT